MNFKCPECEAPLEEIAGEGLCCTECECVLGYKNKITSHINVEDLPHRLLILRLEALEDIMETLVPREALEAKFKAKFEEFLKENTNGRSE